MDQNALQQFLNDLYSQEVKNLEKIGEGEFSKGYFFTANGEDLVIRLNKQDNSSYMFGKDKYAYEHFNQADFPIPEILKMGKIDGLHYVISRKAEGKEFGKFDMQTKQHLIPKLIETLKVMHSIDISDTVGFGYWDEEGKAQYASLTDALLIVENFPLKNNLEDKEFFNIDIYRRLVTKMKDLLVFVPKDKYLVHGDISFSNLISDGQKITAVLDWSAGQYGDFLYDYAYLKFWKSMYDFDKDVLKFYEKADFDLKHYDQRIRCYIFYILLVLMDFYTRTDQEDKYKDMEHKANVYLNH